MIIEPVKCSLSRENGISFAVGARDGNVLVYQPQRYRESITRGGKAGEKRREISGKECGKGSWQSRFMRKSLRCLVGNMIALSTFLSPFRFTTRLWISTSHLVHRYGPFRRAAPPSIFRTRNFRVSRTNTSFFIVGQKRIVLFHLRSIQAERFLPERKKNAFGLRRFNT